MRRNKCDAMNIARAIMPDDGEGKRRKPKSHMMHIGERKTYTNRVMRRRNLGLVRMHGAATARSYRGWNFFPVLF